MSALRQCIERMLEGCSTRSATCARRWTRRRGDSGDFRTVSCAKRHGAVRLCKNPNAGTHAAAHNSVSPHFYTMSHAAVATLVAEHVLASGRRGQRSRWLTRASYVRAWLSVRAGRVLFARWLERDARFWADQAVWYRGAAAGVDRQERDPAVALDATFSVSDRLLKQEQLGMVLRQRLLDLASSLRTPGSHTGEMVHVQALSCAAAMADCHEAMRELRGALQAYEADRCAMVRASSAATAPGASLSVDQALDDIFRA